MDAYDIIIQGGQSNAEGSGIGPVKEKYLPSEDILYLDVEKTVQAPPEGVIVTYIDKPFIIRRAEERPWTGGEMLGDFSLTFAKRYVESGYLKPGRKLLIVRAAIGGTGFQKGNWGVQAPLHKKMLEMTDYALSLNSNNRVVGFLWHQGEHDAFEGNTPDNYYNQLFETVKSVRERYGNIPFIAGDFVNEWKMLNLKICEPIIDVIKKVVHESGNAGFVENTNLLSNNQKIGNGDNIHFCREALYELGERYFEKYKELINGSF